MSKRKKPISDLRRILAVWPEIMCSATDPMARAFAQAIWERSADRFWQPTLKQFRVMRRMFREQLAPGGSQAPILIEED